MHASCIHNEARRRLIQTQSAPPALASLAITADDELEMLGGIARALAVDLELDTAVLPATKRSDHLWAQRDR